MNRIRARIRRHFGFSQREVTGFLKLLGIMVLLTAVPFLFNRYFKAAESAFGTATDRATLDSLVAQLEAKQPVPGQQRVTVPLVALQPFNPNNLTVEQWQAFGVDKYLAQRILNYRDKAGGLTHKTQISRIYGMPDSVYQRLHPYIQLPEERPGRYSPRERIATAPNPTPYEPRNYPPRERFVLAPFNINTADTTQLKQIRGIGSKLSARIVDFRSKLGGIRSVEQLQGLYSLSPAMVDSLQKYTYVHKDFAPSRLSLNTASTEELRAHPYISSNIARAIVAYREQHGPYQQVEDVRKIKLVTQEVYDKLQPYLAL